MIMCLVKMHLHQGFKGWRLPFDVMVSDAVLTDGIPTEAINTFSNNSDGLLVICSGYPKDDPILAELQTESAIFLQKPFSTDELLHKLNQDSRAA